MTYSYLSKAHYLIKILKRAAVIVLVVLAMSVSRAQAGPFNKGSTILGMGFGTGTAFNDNYNIFGLSLGYYVVDGLELGIDYEVWSGGTPGIKQYSPKINYVFSPERTFSLYIGGFYRLIKIEGMPKSNAWGGRTGLYMQTKGKKTFLGLGIAHIRYQDCAETSGNKCSDTYPEFTFGFAF